MQSIKLLDELRTQLGARIQELERKAGRGQPPDEYQRSVGGIAELNRFLKNIDAARKQAIEGS